MANAPVSAAAIANILKVIGRQCREPWLNHS
jgi:hypothetical protein